MANRAKARPRKEGENPRKGTHNSKRIKGPAPSNQFKPADHDGGGAAGGHIIDFAGRQRYLPMAEWTIPDSYPDDDISYIVGKRLGPIMKDGTILDAQLELIEIFEDYRKRFDRDISMDSVFFWTGSMAGCVERVLEDKGLDTMGRLAAFNFDAHTVPGLSAKTVKRLKRAQDVYRRLRRRYPAGLDKSQYPWSNVPDISGDGDGSDDNL